MIQDILLWAKATIAENQIAGGGLLIVAASSAAYWIRSIPMMVIERIRNLIIVEVEIRQPDPLYTWISQWLSTTDYMNKARRLSGVTDDHQLDDDDRRLKIYLIPGIGRHILRHQGHWIIIHRGRDGDAKSNEGGMESLLQRESYNIEALRWSRAAIKDLLDTTREITLEQEGDGPDIYLAQGWGGWERMHRAQYRPLGSVLLPNNIGEDITTKCRTFLKSKDLYRHRGVPWRMGILLHGSPGNGKSSLIMAIASELGVDLGYLNLSDDKIGDSILLELLGAAGKRVIVIEDVDAIYNKREKKDGGKNLSFSGLLNALDGIVSSEGRILVMTTNHLEKLDPALIRQGRVDHVIEIPIPGETELIAIHKRMDGDGDAEIFARAQLGSNMASAQGKLI